MGNILDYARPRAGEKTERANVTVVFLRMTRPPARPAPVLPAGVTITRERLDVDAYRALYNEIGGPWLWWPPAWASMRASISCAGVSRWARENPIQRP